jgi:hypothetical protein
MNRFTPFRVKNVYTLKVKTNTSQLKYNPNAADAVGSTVALIKGTGNTLFLLQYKNVTCSEICKQDKSWVHEFRQKLFNNYGNTKE